MPLDIPGEEIHMMLKAEKLPSVTWGIRKSARYYAGVYRETNDPRFPLELIGYTEVVLDDRSPEWTTFINEMYLPGGIQKILVSIYNLDNGDDTDENKGNDANRKKLCEVHLTLNALMKGRRVLTLPLVVPGQQQTNGAAGTIEIRAEESIPNRDVLTTRTSFKYSSPTIFGTPTTSYTISRVTIEERARTLVYRGNAVKGWEVYWPDVGIELQKLCNADDQRTIFFALYQSGNPNPVGELSTCVADVLQYSREKRTFTIYNTTNKDEVLGQLTIDVVERNLAPTFFDYRKVLNVSVVYAWDFTASNGDPNVPESLHYVDTDPNHLNPYERSTLITGKILQSLDHDQKYQVFAFGAKTKLPNGRWGPMPNHCIRLTAPGADADGVDGVHQLYRNEIHKYMLSGPTCFAPIIREVTHFALENAGDNSDPTNLKYTVFVIITDGNIVDIDDTKAAIVAASKAPLSIIIIGVGANREVDMDRPTADHFAQLRMLDSDGTLLSYNDQVAERDIVQFVPFETTIGLGEDNFAQELQAEFPDQVLQYYDKRGIVPPRS